MVPRIFTSCLTIEKMIQNWSYKVVQRKINDLTPKARQARPTSSGLLTKVNPLLLCELQKARHLVGSAIIYPFF